MKRTEKGQAILEFAVILPVFLLIGVGLVDWLIAVDRAANLEYVVSETARCMAISSASCSNPAGYATRLASGFRMDLAMLKMESAACGLSECNVVMSYRYQAVGAYFPKITIERTGTAALPGPAPPGP